MRTVSIPLVMLSALGVCLPAWAFPWPWHHHHRAHVAARAAAPVHAIAVTAGAGATGASIAEAWDRNTLLIDLTKQAGRGEATLTRLPNAGWPPRLAFRVRPGAIARLTVQGAQRMVFSVPAQGAPLTLELDPGVYVTDTASITVRWSAAAD